MDFWEDSRGGSLVGTVLVSLPLCALGRCSVGLCFSVHATESVVYQREQMVPGCTLMVFAWARERIVCGHMNCCMSVCGNV